MKEKCNFFVILFCHIRKKSYLCIRKVQFFVRKNFCRFSVYNKCKAFPKKKIFILVRLVRFVYIGGGPLGRPPPDNLIFEFLI